MTKKVIAVLLVLCMCFTLTPVMGLSVSAESGENTETVTEETNEQNLDLTAAVGVIKDSLNKTIKKYGVESIFNVKFFVSADESAGLTGNVSVKFDKIGTSATIYLPGSADDTKLFLSWDNNDLKVSYGNKLFSSGELQIPEDGRSMTFVISNGLKTSKISLKTMKGSEDVAAMFLNLDESMGTIADMNADPDHETECFGEINFDEDLNGYISIKGRGNSTWTKEKKPYNITFYKDDTFKKKKSVELVDGVKAKKWSLLANYLDVSLLRNKIGLDLASDLGIGLETRFVDLYMNGEFLGNYLLTPKNDYQSPDGGYSLENDNYLSESENGELKDTQFDLPGMFEIGNIVGDGFYSKITIKDVGDDALDAGVTLDDIQSYVTEAWYAVLDYDSEEYQKYFDIVSWSKMYLMYEVCKTYDAFSGSILMHRDGLTENDKLIAGPTWDMDTTFGRTMYKFFSGITLGNQISAEGLYIDKIGLSASDKPVCLLQELGKHESFMNQVAKTYAEYQWAFDKAVENVYIQQAAIAKSAEMNNDLWGIHHLHVYFVPVPLTIGSGKYQLHYEVTKDWNAFVNNMHEFVEKRVMYLSDIFTTAVPEGKIVGNTDTQNGGKVTLEAVVTNGNNPTYQWQSSTDGINWADLENQNKSILTLNANDIENDTMYRCIVTNNAIRPISFKEGEFTVSENAIIGPVSIKVNSEVDTTEATLNENAVAPTESKTAQAESTTASNETTVSTTEPTTVELTTNSNTQVKTNENISKLLGALDKLIRNKIK